MSSSKSILPGQAKPKTGLILLSCCALITALTVSGCSYPRKLELTETRYAARPSIYPIELYLGEVIQPHLEIAVIESRGYVDDTDYSSAKMMEDLQSEARKIGGDAVHQIRVLTKRVSGYTLDERTPFISWKQGKYPLHFMRGTAIIYASGLPGALATGEGFEIEDESSEESSEGGEGSDEEKPTSPETPDAPPDS